MISPDFPDARKRFRMNMRERRRQAKEAKGASKGGKAAEHGLRAEQLAGEGQIEEAIKAYQQAISIDPQYAVAHHNLGVLLRQQGLLNEAIESYTRATAIQPDYVDAHYNLGNALLDIGNLDAAVSSYHKALAIKPDFAQAHNNLGNAFKDLWRLHEAIASYHKALAIKPDYVEAHSNLGSAFNLARGDRENMNVRGALAHMLADALGSVGAIFAALFLYLGFPLADPIISLLTVVLILWGTIALLRDSSRVLLQFAPARLEVEKIEEALLSLDGVSDIHHLHAWTLDGHRAILTFHMTIEDRCDEPEMRRLAISTLEDAFDLDHITIQVEREGEKCEQCECAALEPGKNQGNHGHHHHHGHVHAH